MKHHMRMRKYEKEARPVQFLSCLQLIFLSTWRAWHQWQTRPRETGLRRRKRPLPFECFAAMPKMVSVLGSFDLLMIVSYPDCTCSHRRKSGRRGWRRRGRRLGNHDLLLVLNWLTGQTCWINHTWTIKIIFSCCRAAWWSVAEFSTRISHSLKFCVWFKRNHHFLFGAIFLMSSIWHGPVCPCYMSPISSSQFFAHMPQTCRAP